MGNIRVPSFRYGFQDSDIEFITDSIDDLLRSHKHLTMGEHGQALEEEFAAYNDSRHAVAMASGTSALEVILHSIGVAGAEVIVPTNTFGATVVAVLKAGATPVFADVGEDMCLSVASVEEKLSPRVRAVITVHIGGLISPATIELADLCRARGVQLVEDAAHAVGSAYAGRKAGSFGVAAAFSLFSTKVMTCGEGGLIATDDDQIWRTASLLRDHAKNHDGTMSVIGYNWRLTEFQAIVGRAQLRRLDDLISSRDAAAAAYDAYLRDRSGLRVLTPPAKARHNRYKYIVFLDEVDPTQVQQALLSQFGVALGGYVYDTPCHQQEAFKNLAVGELPVAERLCRSHICLPVYPYMTEVDVAYVGSALTEVLGPISTASRSARS